MEELNEKEYYRDKIRKMLDEYDDLEADKYFCAFIEKKIELRKAGK